MTITGRRHNRGPSLVLGFMHGGERTNDRFPRSVRWILSATAAIRVRVSGHQRVRDLQPRQLTHDTRPELSDA
jgi:hypothetical protein